MGMREIAIEAMRKRNAGISKEEIRAFIHNQASLLGGITAEVTHEDQFSIRLTTTGEVVRYDGQDGYSYKPSGQ
jgi:hypothetical protein